MGTVPIAENLRVACSDGTLVGIEVLTTTGDLMSGADGTVEVYGESAGERRFAFLLPLPRFTDGWLARFCDAIAADSAFRASLSDIADADALVIPAAPARDGGRLGALIRKGGAARFGDFVGVRSGRDRFSGLRLADLEAEAGPRACTELDGRMDRVSEAIRAAERAKALRWFLRGLPIAMAARKVDVDREVSANASGRSGR